jgi:acetyl-CoA carboxylase biotin carboxyl carrier protein
MNIDEIARLAELMTEHELAEISIRTEELKLKLRRGSEPVMSPVAMPAAMTAPQPVGVAAPATAETDSTPPSSAALITSPIVGTFYQASAPDAPPFVQVGDVVTPDTVVCIIEAMKVMNEIKAEQSGVIRKVLIDNATPVEYGQPLFEVDPA